MKSSSPRAQAGRAGGVVAATPCLGVPPLDLDQRKWPAVSLRRLALDQVLALPVGTLACLDTPFIVQGETHFTALLPQVYSVMEPGGYWRFVDLMLPAMPAHWLFTYFPEAWVYVRGSGWTSSKLYNILREADFGVKLREHSFYQAVSLGVAHAERGAHAPAS